MSYLTELSDFLTVKEVADILAINERTVYRNKKDIPGFLKIKGKIFFVCDIFFKETGFPDKRKQVAEKA